MMMMMMKKISLSFLSCFVLSSSLFIACSSFSKTDFSNTNTTKDTKKADFPLFSSKTLKLDGIRSRSGREKNAPSILARYIASPRIK